MLNFNLKDMLKTSVAPKPKTDLFKQSLDAGQQAVDITRRTLAPDPAPLAFSSPSTGAPNMAKVALGPALPDNYVASPTDNKTLEAIRAGITKLESGGNYKARSKTSSASGRYQYIKATWGGYGGYTHAADAPPVVQDQKFNQDMGRYLKRYNGNLQAAAIAWFQGPGVADKFFKGDNSVLSKTDANGKTTGSYATQAAAVARKFLTT